jgi:hypothetical protein
VLELKPVECSTNGFVFHRLQVLVQGVPGGRAARRRPATLGGVRP